MKKDKLAVIEKPDAVVPVVIKPIPSEIMDKPFENEFNINALLPSAGTLELTDNQKKILFAEPKEEDIEVRPDGLVYLPWMEYVCRLRESFGVNWAMIPQGMPKKEGSLILWGFYLVIQGKLMGFAIGQQEYYESNPTMTWGDACEGAKSNALMRLCKGIGISIELWKPSFVKAWKDKYTESYTYYNKRKEKEEIRWRKKNGNHQPDRDIPKEMDDHFSKSPKTVQKAPEAPILPSNPLKPESIGESGTNLPIPADGQTPKQYMNEAARKSIMKHAEVLKEIVKCLNTLTSDKDEQKGIVKRLTTLKDKKGDVVQDGKETLKNLTEMQAKTLLILLQEQVTKSEPPKESEEQ